MLDKARQVRSMFGTIAHRYDLLNHLLSVNIDRRWRRACLQEVEKRLVAAPAAILDVGCGTGDLSLTFSALGPTIGCDFCHPMLRIAAEKIARNQPRPSIFLLEGDALELPFPDGTFDVVVSAFVLRNLAGIEKGLCEMRRVLRPGGVFAALDFSMPKVPLLGSIYRIYFLKILPWLGSLISGVEGPYKYLPESVQEFPGPEELRAVMERSGFRQAEHRLLSGGIAVLLLARGT